MACQGQLELSSKIATLHAHRCALIGPHGGAMHIQWWAGPETVLIDFIPESWPNVVVFWDHASMQGQVRSHDPLASLVWCLLPLLSSSAISESLKNALVLKHWSWKLQRVDSLS